MDTSLSNTRARYANLMRPESPFWGRPPRNQVHALKAWISVLEAKPGDEGYDISSDTTFTWTE